MLKITNIPEGVYLRAMVLENFELEEREGWKSYKEAYEYGVSNKGFTHSGLEIAISEHLMEKGEWIG